GTLAARAPLEAGQGEGRRIALGGAEEVQALERIEPIAEGPHGARLLFRVSAFPAQGRLEALDVLLQRAVVARAALLKCGHDVPRPALANRVGGKHGGRAAEGNDFAPQPLEVLAALVGIRQDVHRVARRDGAQLLEAAPRLDAGVREPRWKLVREE